MPKSAGSDLQAIRTAPTRPAPSVRKIDHQSPPVDGPHRNPPSAGGQMPSNKLAADAVRIAKNPGSIDPRQMRD
jgi:hypothetical protein